MKDYISHFEYKDFVVIVTKNTDKYFSHKYGGIDYHAFYKNRTTHKGSMLHIGEANSIENMVLILGQLPVGRDEEMYYRYTMNRVKRMAEDYRMIMENEHEIFDDGMLAECNRIKRYFSNG